MVYLYYKEEWYKFHIISKSQASILRVSFNHRLTHDIEDFFKEIDIILKYENNYCAYWDI